jgi:cytochrome c peroxidase
MRDGLQRLDPHHLLAVSVGLAIAVGCSRSTRSTRSTVSAPDATPIEESGAAPSAVTQVVQGFAREGGAAAQQLAGRCDDRGAYLAVRRNAAASLSVWRRWVGIPAEAAFGPEVPIQEAGGSIGALDRALSARDCNAALEASGNVGAAFRVSEAAIERMDIPPADFGQALSDASYRLGQAILEATVYVPEGDDAALADVLGFLDLIEGGARALGLDVTSETAPLERLRTVQTLADATDRAALVRATGALGGAIRRDLGAIGIATTLMYRPLRDAADIGALTLPRPALPVDPAKVALGRRLFFDRRLSPRSARACATCHVPARAYSDGLVAPASLDPTAALRRNTPSLLYAPLEALLTWDGRVRTADRQALMVLAADAAYAGGFRGAFEDGVTAQNIGRALASFEASDLVPGDAPIDRFARGGEGALSTDARAGLDVFAGKGRCARCHVPPVFSGSRPPDFTAPVFAVLGVPSTPDATTVDADPGRGGGDFRVPTVRNAGRTAPYFHHGRYATLEQVVDFYDRGGGKGLGLDVPNQDPEIRPLRLTAEDRRVLLVFLRDALTDGH